MTRATETAMIIQDVLGETKTKSCDLIREGAPIKPEPPVSHWKPEVYVSVLITYACYLRSYCYSCFMS